jgi:hypothetical protein
MTLVLTPVPLEELRGNPRNPKRHDNTTINKSMGRFGMIEPVVVDKRTGWLISGHGRVETLQERKARGEQPPEGVGVDEEGRWLVPAVTSWSSRSDDEAEAALVALNRTVQTGGWDDDLLADILVKLQEQDAMDGVGFAPEELDLMMRKLDAAGTVTADLSDVIDEFVGTTHLNQVGTKAGMFRTLVVHFPTEPDARRFYETLGMPYDLTERSTVYPPDSTYRRRKQAREWTDADPAPEMSVDA